jgi:hypothetical protein
VFDLASSDILVGTALAALVLIAVLALWIAGREKK